MPSSITRSRTLRTGLGAALEDSRALIEGPSAPSPVIRPIAGGADSDTSLIIDVLAGGGACLECLVSTTGLPEPRVTRALQQLSGATIITVEPCSRCGNEDRLFCRLAR